MRWKVERHVNGVESLHSLGVPESPQRVLRWCVPERSALVLGSTQPGADVDALACKELDLDIVRRTSGGGAVLVQPEDLVWADVFVPAQDRLWQHDVGHAFAWLGEAWATALEATGIAGVEVHAGAMVKTRWSSKVCFAGLGPGEVTLAGRKVVGISQRRNRLGALFQCAAVRHLDVDRTLMALELSSSDRHELTIALEHLAVIDAGFDEAVLAEALETALEAL